MLVTNNRHSLSQCPKIDIYYPYEELVPNLYLSTNKKTVIMSKLDLGMINMKSIRPKRVVMWCECGRILSETTNFYIALEEIFNTVPVSIASHLKNG